jgi:2-hydroxymuconate-semialdehyde hydrolase
MGQKSRKTKFAVGLGLAFSVLAATWLVGAVKSGAFIAEDDRPASAPSESSMEDFSKHKKFITVGPWRVAYVDEGAGDPILLLHGCPFQGYEYSRIIPILARNHRVIVPDLLGLGDTIVRLNDDYRLPNQVKMVVGLMDGLGIDSALVVGHDHGAAIAQLMMRDHPERLRAVVLTNAEAYDQWPSKPESLDLDLLINPVSAPFFRLALATRVGQRWIYRIAVYNQSILTDEVLNGIARPNLATPERWRRLRRFLRWQRDHDHNLETMRAVEGIRRFRRPTLILWGKNDTNFGPAIAERLARDIPGTVGIHWLEKSAHLPMLEEPEAYADAIEQFSAGSTGGSQSGKTMESLTDHGRQGKSP